MKSKKFLWVCMLIVLSFTVLADWNSYGKDNFNTQRVGDKIGLWDSDSGTPNTLVGETPDYQPTYADFDNDGIDEVVYTDGSYIRVAESTGLTAELNVGSTVTSPVTIYTNSSNTSVLLFFNSSHFNSYIYDGSTFTNLATTLVEKNSTGEPFTAEDKNIKCSIYEANRCNFLNDFGNICEVNSSDGGMVCYDVINSASTGEFMGAMATLTASTNEMFVTKYSVNSFLVFDTVTNSLFTSFSADGKYTFALGGNYWVSNPVIYNINGVGDAEIIFNAVEGNAGNTNNYIYMFRSDGSAYGSSPYNPFSIANTGGFPRCSDPTILIQPNPSICQHCYSSVHNNVTCFDGSQFIAYPTSNTSLTGAGGVNQIITNLVGADMDADGTDELVMANGIWEQDGTSLFNVGDTKNANFILGDFQGTSDISYFTYNGSNSYFYFSGSDNAVPTLTDTYGRNWDNPVCNGTTVRYLAKEYDELSTQLTGTNYYNDGDYEQERLIAECHGNTTLTNGTYQLSEPFVECTYNQVGTYVARIYLQDASHNTDYTVYDDVNVLVVDGVAGVTCNTGSLGIGEESVEGTAIDGVSNPTQDGIGTFLDYLTGGDGDYQIFIGMAIFIIIILSVGIGMATVTQNGMAVAISVGVAGVVSFICLTALGLFPAWLLVLIMLILTLGTVLVLALRVGGG